MFLYDVCGPEFSSTSPHINSNSKQYTSTVGLSVSVLYIEYNSMVINGYKKYTT